ncbi:hypothetical protein EBO15_30395 [Actinomadura harenae]|uniref:Uncharacterized protein n=1 Tax=Actinomadura harenae TaxID=2483351 RepID=A0A3M2LP14_9ACTN|nr:hypothetical protein EBO15_30395 [Actinomadura harenae]
MEPTGKKAPTAAVIGACLGAAGLFEALTLFATHDKPVRAVSPWQDDPYDAVLSFTQFAVPMLAAVVLLRLLVRRAPDAPGRTDRAQQTARAAGAMLALAALTLAAEWASVIARVGYAAWNGWTAFLIGGLAVNSLVTGLVLALLRRYRAPRGSSGRWRHDWLGDVVLLCERIPVLRILARPEAAGWVRRHALTVFVAASTVAATGITAAQAIGERWTDPLLVLWMFAVELTAFLAFCVLANAVAGFIARPARPRGRRVAESSLVVGAVATHLTVAFRNLLWPGATPLTSVPTVFAFTFGVGLAAGAAAVLLQLVPAARVRSRAG